MLPDDVLQFVRAAIRSVWVLELLLQLHRDPGRAWGVDELIRELRASTGIVAGGLAELVSARLVEENGGLYRYKPLPALAGLVERLAAAYSTYPVAVTQAILSAPSDRIQSFADAFRIKKE